MKPTIAIAMLLSFGALAARAASPQDGEAAPEAKQDAAALKASVEGFPDRGTRPADPAAPAPLLGGKLEPFLAMVGGVEVETLQKLRGDDREDRLVTVAISRFGLRGKPADGIYVESEFEVNGGPHGTSVWEGQAALQVRNQLVRLVRGKLRVDAGRITDDATLDFFSEHVADQLLTDEFTRYPILASGYNRGNGVLARWKLIPGLEPGLSVSAANPVSTTASLMVGGTYPPFSRFYVASHQQVGRDASKFPADEFHIVVVTPSVTFARGPLRAQGALQVFQVNTNTSSSEDAKLDGVNARAGVAATFRPVTVFVNGSVVQNEMVDPDQPSRLSGEVFTGYTASGGADVNWREHDGVGAQYAWVREQQGFGAVSTYHFFNVGTTHWVDPTTAVGARVASFVVCEDADGSGGSGCKSQGETSYFLTLRTLF